MTKKPKYVSKNRFAENKLSEDEIVLADLDVNLDDSDISPVPIDSFIDEDKIIDSLLLDNQTHNFDEVDYVENDEKQIDDISLIDDSKNSAHFEVGPIDDAEDNQEYNITDTVNDEIETSETFSDEFISNENEEEIESVDEVNKHHNSPKTETETETETETSEPKLSGSRPIDNATALNLIKDALLSDHAFVSSLTKDSQPFRPYIPPITKVNKGRSISNWLLLVLGLIAIGLSVKVLWLSEDVSKLQSLTSILEEDVSILQEKKPVNIPSAIQNPSESPATINPIEAQNLTHEQQNSQSAVKVASSVVEKSSVIPLETKLVEVTEKPIDIQEQIKEPKPESVIKQHSKKLNLKVVTRVEKQGTKSVPKKDYVFAPWAVNVVAFKNEIEAKKKSAKLISQGIPVKIDSFNTSNGKWYQLKVDGFKNRDNAHSYANKLRKSINLNTISVVVN